LLLFCVSLENLTISKNPFRIYGIVNFIETAVNALGMQALKITDVKRVHVKLIIRKQRAKSGNSTAI
jgi:hypothetical protein